MKEDLIILFKSLLIFLIGAGVHFLYDISGDFAGFAWFCPVNESVWEHLKLCYYPFLIFGLLYCVWNNKKDENWSMEGSMDPKKTETGRIDLNNFLRGLMKASLCSIIIVLFGHYVGLGGFGFSGSLWDIPVYAASIIPGTVLWNKNHRDSIPMCFVILYHIAVIAGFAYFTWFPGNFPIFVDYS